MVTIRVPAPPPGLFANLLGVVGLGAIVAAVAYLTDWRWALLLAGGMLVGLSYVAALNAAAAAPAREESPGPATAPAPKPAKSLRRVG